MNTRGIPRGIRNHNPGNVEYHIDGDEWDGMCEEQEDGRFLQFDEAVMGIRCIAKLLLNYQARSQCQSVKDIINRWAPPFENDTTAYIEHVAALLEVEPEDEIRLRTRDLDKLPILIKAIIQHENGVQPYSNELIDEAIEKAIA